MTERFDVWQYLPDDWHEKVGEDLDAKAAVELAHSYTTRPAAIIGIIRKVQIVARDDDATVFLWRFGEGVVYPTEESDRFPNRKESYAEVMRGR